MKFNKVWDGLFHAFTWAATAVGLGLLRRAGTRREATWSGRIIAGALTFGWGLLDVVEGLIDHEILGLHHVHGAVDPLAWDLGFLALGAVPMALGGRLMSGQRERRVNGATARPSPP